MTRQPPAPRFQTGAVLLVLFLMLIAVSTSIFLASVNTHSVEVRQFHDVRLEMEKAKQALIAYAVNYPNFGFDSDGDSDTTDEGTGRFPCPDTDDPEIDTLGLKNSNTTDCTPTVRGRLPKSVSFGSSTFELNSYFSDIDQQFWYVVDPVFAEISTGGVNVTSTTGTLTIDGIPGYVAVIIAPGKELSSQDRSASATATGNYLEQGNVSGTAFVNSYDTDPDAFNDQVIGITFDEIKDRMVMMAAEKIGERLKAYYGMASNYPANKSELQTYLSTNGPAWLVDSPQDDWLSDLTYLYFYSPTSYNLAYYYFNSCSSVIFYMNYGSDLFKTANSC